MSIDTIHLINELPIKGHRYEFVAGKARKDGKFPVYIKDIVLVQNGNKTYWSRRAPKRLVEAVSGNTHAVLLVRECVYMVLRRAGVTAENALIMANNIHKNN